MSKGRGGLALILSCLLATTTAVIASGRTAEPAVDPMISPIPVMQAADSDGDDPDMATTGWRITPAAVQRRIADAFSDFVAFCSRLERHLTPQQNGNLAALLRTL